MAANVDSEILDQENNSQEGENVDEYLPPNEEEDQPQEEETRIEDLPLEKRIEHAKNCPNPFGTVKPGVWLDALDSINAWLPASIVEVDGNTIKVHFDGWPDKWDEWMRLSSYKVASFRKHSVGYGGQTKIAIRKKEPSLEDYKNMYEKMDACIKSNLKGLGAIETTQFFRGDIFFGLDNLMGRAYEPEESDLFEFSIEFIKKCLELIATYLKLVPDMLSQFEEDQIEEDLYLVDENVAIAKCYPEFTEILKTIF